MKYTIIKHHAFSRFSVLRRVIPKHLRSECLRCSRPGRFAYTNQNDDDPRPPSWPNYPKAGFCSLACFEGG